MPVPDRGLRSGTFSSAVKLPIVGAHCACALGHLMADGEPLYYRLDRDDRIVEVGGNWDQFAQQNGGDEIVSHRVIGTPLFKYIDGETSRDHIWTAVDSVRKLSAPRKLAYRCDSPDLKRYMEMLIKPDVAGGVVVEHTTLRVEPLTPTIRFVSGGASQALVIRCSMCSRVRIKGLWIEPDAAMAERLIAPNATHRVAYGVCVECRTLAGRAPTHPK